MRIPCVPVSPTIFSFTMLLGATRIAVPSLVAWPQHPLLVAPLQILLVGALVVAPKLGGAALFSPAPVWPPPRPLRLPPRPRSPLLAHAGAAATAAPQSLRRGLPPSSRVCTISYLASRVFFIGRNSPIFPKFPFYPRGPIKFEISQFFPFFPVSTQTIQNQSRDGPTLIMIYSCFDL
jgi:hypothetical protein